MGNYFDRLDTGISHWSEDIVRRMGRRQLLRLGFKGLATTVAGLTIGTFVGMGTAEAASCSYPGCGACNACRGKTCPSGGGCPSGCVLCKSGDGCAGCPHADGQWTSGGCGTCGNGWIICSDCRCTSCSTTCGCNSACICSGCCSPEEVKAEMVRQARRAREEASVGA